MSQSTGKAIGGSGGGHGEAGAVQPASPEIEGLGLPTPLLGGQKDQLADLV
jgi:hypothetical protein